MGIVKSVILSARMECFNADVRTLRLTKEIVKLFCPSCYDKAERSHVFDSGPPMGEIGLCSICFQGHQGAEDNSSQSGVLVSD